MLLEYSLTKDDLFNFTYYTGWASPEKKSYRLKYYLKTIGVTYLSVLFIFLARKDNFGILHFLVLFGIATFTGFLAAHIGIEAGYKNRIRKFISHENNAAFFSQRQLILSNEGIVERDENSDTKIAWSAIVKKAETKEYIYLYLSSMHGIAIPKKVLAKEKLKELDLLLNQNIELKAQLNHLYK